MNAELFTKYGFFVNDGQYWTLKGQYEVRITCFIIEPINRLYIQGSEVWNCLLKNNFGEKFNLLLSAEEMSDVKRFESCLNSCQGDFEFYGDDEDLGKIRQWLSETMHSMPGGDYPLQDSGKFIKIVRDAFVSGDVRCVEWKRYFCAFTIRNKGRLKPKNPEDATLAYVVLRLSPEVAMCVMRNVPIVPFKFFMEEYRLSENPSLHLENEGGQEDE